MLNTQTETKTIQKKKKFHMPSTPVLLLAITLIIAILTYIVPAGQFERVYDEEKDRTLVVAGTYHEVEQSPVGIGKLFSSVFEGLYKAADLICFVFVVGGSFYIVQSTGAINAGLGKLIKRFSGNGKEYIMIGIVMVAFAIGGASFGMAEETLPFVTLCVLAAKAMGYDAIVGISMVLVGCYCGYSAGPLNPFNTGIGQTISELPMFSGAGLRVVLMIGSLIIAFHHTIRYCKKLKKQGTEQLSEEAVAKLKAESEALNIEFTKQHKIILLVVLVTFIALVFGVMKYGWYFSEISALFFAMGLITGVIHYKGNFEKILEVFIAGAGEMCGAALLMGMSRTILVVAEQGAIMDTIVYALSIPLSHLPNVITACGMYIAQGFINFLIPSSSGQAVVVMPIMSALSDLIGVTRQTAVLAFTCGDGFWNMITPTHSVVMATLGLAGISFGKWFKYALSLVLKWSLWICAILIFATLTGWGPF